MDEPTRGASPESAPAAPTEIAAPAAPATPQAPPSSLPTSDQIKAAKSPLALRELMNGLAKAPPPPAAPAAPPAIEGTAPAAELVAEPAAAPAEPEGTAPETAEPAEPDAPETDPEPEGDAPVAPSSASKLRLRLRDDDKVGRLATAYQQRNRDWTLEQAMDAARNQLGIKPEPKAGAPTPNEPAKPQLPQTVEAVDQAVDQLYAEQRTAYSAMDFDKVAEINEKIHHLERHKVGVERQAQATQRQQARAYDDSFDASTKSATDLYEFMKAPESPAYQRMLEIDQTLQETNDPLFHDPEKPLRIAQMVAKEFTIAPRSKTKPQAKPVVPAAPVAKPKNILPGGSSATVQKPVNTPPAIDAEIKAANTPLALRKLNQKLGIRSLI